LRRAATCSFQAGLDLGAEAIAAEARRFHLDVPTGIDLPQETRAMMIPTAQWKRARFKESWTGGDTANMAIGQGAVTDHAAADGLLRSLGRAQRGLDAALHAA
jgi:hypothetical protein